MLLFVTASGKENDRLVAKSGVEALAGAATLTSIRRSMDQIQPTTALLVASQYVIEFSCCCVVRTRMPRERRHFRHTQDLDEEQSPDDALEHDVER